MPSRPRLIFIVFFLTGAMIFVVALRTASSRVFNQYRSAMVVQERFSQELRNQQFRMETLISPYRVEQEMVVPQPVQSR